MNLANILLDTARKFPDRTAVVFYDRRISYKQLLDDAMRFAAALQGAGVGPGTRVAIALPNVPEFAVAYFGFLAAGAEVVQINPLYTAREIGFIFKDADVKFAITHPMFAESVMEAAAQCGADVLFSDSMGDPAKIDIKSFSSSSRLDAAAPKNPRDTAMIIYTNAVQGDPMGACLSHAGLAFDADACRKVADITPDDSFITILPLFHAFSLTVCLNLPVLTGAKSVFHETFNEQRAADDIVKERASLFPAVPTIFKRMLDKLGQSGLDFSAVKGFIPGGAPPVYPDLYLDFAAAFKATVFEGYGITECGPVTSVNPIAKKINKHGSIGLPLDNIYVRVVDDAGNDLPNGETGELLIKGDNVMEKYLNRPEETARFLKDGWLHTGDLAALDEDNFIFIKGVKKRMLLVGGFNVYPVEVEKEILKHPAVKSCRVFGAPDDSLGERTAAEVVLNDGAALTRVELQKFLRKSLAPYKVPRSLEIS